MAIRQHLFSISKVWQEKASRFTKGRIMYKSILRSTQYHGLVWPADVWPANLTYTWLGPYCQIIIVVCTYITLHLVILKLIVCSRYDNHYWFIMKSDSAWIFWSHMTHQSGKNVDFSAREQMIRRSGPYSNFLHL